MSNTYTNWSIRNFKLNNLTVNDHEFIKADCIKWLSSDANANNRYDFIFIDPPTFSNSKSMEDMFDVQKDHVFLIESAMKLLAEDGVILFSNNFRKFKLDKALSEKYNIENITSATIPEDFKRNQKIHHCFIIKQK